MRIRTVIIIGLATCLTLAVGGMAAVSFAIVNVIDAQRQTEFADRVRQSVFLLTALTTDYLLSPEARSRMQWQRTSTSLGEMLAANDLDGGANDIRALRRHHRDMTAIFDQLVLLGAEDDGEGGVRTTFGIATARLQERLVDKALAIDDVVTRLNADARIIAERTIATASWLAGALILGAVLAIAATWVLVNHRLFRPLRTVEGAIRRFSAGELGHRVGLHGDDEIGAIGSSLDAMALSLQTRDREIRQKNQALARSNEDLEQFAYVASHDLQEPLRTVASYCELIRRRYYDKLDDEGREFIDFAVDGAQRMRSLIEGLLQFSRIHTRGQEPVETDADAVLAGTLHALSATISDAGAIVTHDHLPKVMADTDQLGRLFLNLIGNALKFRSDEAPRIHITAERDGNRWRFAISDNGIGFEERHHDRIFQLYKRLNGRANYPGHGLGLTIAKQIVERHGGHIWAKSTPGVGSTFYFTMASTEQDAAPTDVSLQPAA